MNNARVCRELKRRLKHKHCLWSERRARRSCYLHHGDNQQGSPTLSQARRKRVSRANVSAQFSDVGTRLHAAPPRRAQPVPDLI